MEQELHVYYSLTECQNTDKVFKFLNELQNDDKISWNRESSFIIKVEDIDLDESEVLEVINFFDKMDVMPDTDVNDEDMDLSDEDDWGYDED